MLGEEKTHILDFFYRIFPLVFGPFAEKLGQHKPCTGLQLCWELLGSHRS